MIWSIDHTGVQFNTVGSFHDSNLYQLLSTFVKHCECLYAMCIHIKQCSLQGKSYVLANSFLKHFTAPFTSSSGQELWKEESDGRWKKTGAPRWNLSKQGESMQEPTLSLKILEACHAIHTSQLLIYLSALNDAILMWHSCVLCEQWQARCINETINGEPVQWAGRVAQNKSCWFKWFWLIEQRHRIISAARSQVHTPGYC